VEILPRRRTMVSPAESSQQWPPIYEGEGDSLMQSGIEEMPERLILVPDSFPGKQIDPTPRLRIMWGQHLLEDLLLGRYRSFVCAVNAEDNSRGIIAQLAETLPTSQWDERSITAYANQFKTQAGGRGKVLKFDMDIVEVLAILRPANHDYLTLEDLGKAFKIVSQMIQRKPLRTPSVSVSFLGARANALKGPDGKEPSFEAVLKVMYDAGYTGDVYPSPAMWHVPPLGLYPRYPFPEGLEQRRQGGY
jgi:hypothetical protein